MRRRSGTQLALDRLAARRRPRRFLARVLVAALLAGQAAVVFAVPASASGPTTLSVSPWQVFSNTNLYANPGGTLFHGNPAFFDAAPAIPGVSDPGWANCGPSSPIRFSSNGTGPLCPNATTIGMAVGSILPGCWSNLNFTFFQALVSIPAGTTISQFSVNMSGADDGARISLVNSANPNGFTPANGYINANTGQATGNLATSVVAGEVNRVVITQVDDCAVGNNLNSAQIFLNGTVIPPNTPPAVAVTGVSQGASYQHGQVPASGCAASDAQDGAVAATKTTSAISGPNAGIGLGSQTVTCTAIDSAGASASAAATYAIVDNVRPTISAAVTTSPNGNNWYSGNVIVHFTCNDSVGLAPGACPADEVLTGEGPAVSSTSKTVTDVAGNVSLPSNVVTVAIDRTDPSASAAATTSPNDNGWYAGDVDVAFTCADAAGGSGVASCPGTQTLTGEGAGVSSTAGTATDGAGNVSPPSNVVKVNIDRTKPVVTASATTNPNGAGWYKGNVVVHFTCTDAGGSGVVSCPADQVLTGEGASVSSTAVTIEDEAGNVSSPSNVVTVSIDRTKPVVTAAATTAPNGFGWYAGDVVVDFTCSDAAGGSGVASCPANQTLTGEGAAVSSTAVTVTDKAGNVSSPSNVVEVAIDRTDPLVAFSGATAYGLLDTVNITCSATDALSGIWLSTCATTSGPAWSFGPGLHTRTAAAVDRAGNSSSASRSFRVTATADSLCALVHRFTDHHGTRTSLCAHLTNFERSRSRGQAGPAAAQLEAFRKEAASRSGKQLTAAEVAVLIGWANTL